MGILIVGDRKYSLPTRYQDSISLVGFDVVPEVFKFYAFEVVVAACGGHAVQ